MCEGGGGGGGGRGGVQLVLDCIGIEPDCTSISHSTTATQKNTQKKTLFSFHKVRSNNFDVVNIVRPITDREIS